MDLRRAGRYSGFGSVTTRLLAASDVLPTLRLLCPGVSAFHAAASPIFYTKPTGISRLHDPLILSG
ncbi:MAG TPA: hypothetical protein VFL96_08760 [Acidobacteriaceae bacterium]|nr:hypothetical protein [Acidobacteriaceae bacterium]